MKKECRGVSRLLWDYTCHRLAEREVDRVEMHIARCSRCRSELLSYRLTAGLVDVYRDEAEPESKTTWHALRTQLEHMQRDEPALAAPRARRSSALPAWAGAVTAGAMLASVWSMTRPTEPAVPDSLLPQFGRGIDSSDSQPPVVAIQPAAPGSSDIQETALPEPMKPRIQPASFQSAVRRPAAALNPQNTGVSDNPSRNAGKRSENVSPPNDQRKVKPGSDKSASPESEADLIPESGLILPQREFVMGGIPTSGPRIVPVSTGSDAEESPVW
jgi:hypothetical protein